MNSKIRVGVIYGGKSGEHEVSLNSAASILRSLDPDKYDVVPIAVDKDGKWHVDVTPAALAARTHTALLASGEPAKAALATGGIVPATQVPPALTGSIDVILPVLHGSFGEDGTIQGLFEVLDVPYVGAGVLASAVGMDKVFMKQVFGAAGLPQVNYCHYLRKSIENDIESIMTDIEQKLGYPCFVKPANLGSSVGISKAKDRAGLRDALLLAKQFDRKVIVEQGLTVREVEVAVLGNDEPLASVPGEVIPSNEFYDYRAKYIDGESELIIPAPLPNEVTEEVRALAVHAFQALDCSGLARVDFFVERQTGRVLVNEINTMPGFTQFSMYPKLWEATGVLYPELLDKLIQLAIERHDDRRQTQTDYHWD